MQKIIILGIGFVLFSSVSQAIVPSIPIHYYVESLTDSASGSCRLRDPEVTTDPSQTCTNLRAALNATATTPSVVPYIIHLLRGTTRVNCSPSAGGGTITVNTANTITILGSVENPQ